MTVMKNNKYIYFFLIIVGVILFSPMNIYAKAVKCSYSSDDALTVYETVIYDDNTQKRDTSRLKKFKGKSTRILVITEKIFGANKEEFEDGYKDLKKEVATKSEDVKCPNYALIYKDWSFHVFGFFSKSDLDKKVQEIKKKNYVITHSVGSSEYAAEHNSGNNTTTITEDSNSIKDNSCKKILGKTSDSNSVAYLLQLLFNYIKVLGPILVIVFSSIDFTKTILSSDEKAMKSSQKKLGIRLLCAVGLYFLPTLVTLMINLVFGTSGNQVCGIK